MSISVRVHLCDRSSPAAYAGSDSPKPESYGAVLLDIGGTLLETSQPVPEVYARIGVKHGEFVFHVYVF